MNEPTDAYADNPELRVLWKEWSEAQSEWVRLETELGELETGLVGGSPVGLEDFVRVAEVREQVDEARARYERADAAYIPAREAYFAR